LTEWQDLVADISPNLSDQPLHSPKELGRHARKHQDEIVSSQTRKRQRRFRSTAMVMARVQRMVKVPVAKM
jgi:hypothetical protein